MTDTTALKALLAKVEAEGKHPTSYEVYEAFGGDDDSGPWCIKASHGSTDAALSLLAAVLPGWSIELVIRPFGIRPHKAHVLLTTDHTGWGNGRYINASADTPARALLIATLKALIAVAEE